MKQRSRSPILIRNLKQEEQKISAEERIINYEVKLHWHDYVELELVTNGSGHHIFNGEQVPFEKGTVVLSHHSDYHYLMPNDEVKTFNVSFSQSVLSEKISQKLDSLTHGFCFTLDSETYSTIFDLMKILVKEEEVGNENLVYMVNLIECVIIKVFEKIDQTIDEKPLTTIQQIISYLHSHFTEDPSLEEVAKMFHYHPKHFCTVFHRETEVKYSEYLSRLKVNYAKTLLSTTNFDVEYICTVSGFGSMVNFRRVFKELCGVTPLKYRMNKRAILDKLPNIGWKNKTSNKNESIGN